MRITPEMLARARRLPGRAWGPRPTAAMLRNYPKGAVPYRGNPGVKGTAGPLPPRQRGSYDIDDAQSDTIGRSTPVDGVAFGQDRGLGVYRGKHGKLTYKGSGPGNPGTRGTAGAQAPQKPGGAKPPSKLGPDAASDPNLKVLLDAIQGYNLGRAEMLKGIGPEIQAAYGTAGDAITGYGQGLSEGLRSTLTAQGDEAAGQFDQVTENLFPGQGNRIRGAYNADAAADVGYGIGAALPATSLAEQGAAYRGAAAFLPGAAAQQGQYALSAAARDYAEQAAKASGSAAGAPKASSSLSKSLGYLVDAYGKPILDKKGKRIPLPEQGLTPYQQAQLDLSRQKEDRYIDSENFDRQVALQRLQFSSQANKLAVQRLLRQGRQIDASASRGLGYVVLKDGSIPKGPNGKRIPFKSSTSSTSAKSGYQKAVAFAMDDELRGEPQEHPTREGWYYAKPGAKGTERDARGRAITSDPRQANRVGGYSYPEALRILMERYGLNRSQARRALFTAGWKPPAKPKPKTKKKDYGLNPRANLTPEQRKRYDEIRAGKYR